MVGELALRRTDDLTLVRELCERFMGKGTWADVGKGDAAHWLLWQGGNPVGFCSARHLGNKTIYLSGSGVCPRIRGAGLQRRMLRVRLAWARKKGATVAITYTLADNYPSITNLIKSGFRFYSPQTPWVGEEKIHYFRKQL